MENVTDHPQKTNSSLADAATASASGSSSNGSTVSQLQPVSGADTLLSEPMDSRAAGQAVQYNAETLHLPRHRMDQPPHPTRTLPIHSPTEYYQYSDMQNVPAAVMSSSFDASLQTGSMVRQDYRYAGMQNAPAPVVSSSSDANLQTGSMVHQDGNPFRRDSRYHAHPTRANPAVTLPLQQAPPGFLSTLHSSGLPVPQIPPHRQQVIPGTAAFEGLPSVTPALRKTSHLPATPRSIIQIPTAPTDFPSQSVPQDPRAPHVASSSPEAVPASQVKPKRKRGNDASSVLVAERGDEQGTVIQDVPACSEAIPSTDSNSDDDSPTGPEDPDWDMWIKEPSTAKDGPSAKETLIAGKLDWKTPVLWAAVTKEKQAQAIRRLRFWMGWTREKAETHLKRMTGKWFSEKKRQAADRENPERVKRTRKAEVPSISTAALITGLPVISAVAPSTEIPSTTTDDTPLFLFSGDESDSDDDMAWNAEHAVIEAVLNEIRSTNFESLTNPESTGDVADDGITEGPQDVPSQTTVPYLGTRRPGPDFSRLRLTGPFFASWTTGVTADATVPSAVLPTGSTSGDGSETAGTSPEEA
ncbi:hypothetical protein BZA77DRAFT_371808 [Pyronema omphalodes]|nr:hypothetical protein BZA77DRAFT_371808 [Pyronema omphalodes]